MSDTPVTRDTTNVKTISEPQQITTSVIDSAASVETGPTTEQTCMELSLAVQKQDQDQHKEVNSETVISKFTLAANISKWFSERDPKTLTPQETEERKALENFVQRYGRNVQDDCKKQVADKLELGESTVAADDVPCVSSKESSNCIVADDVPLESSKESTNCFGADDVSFNSCGESSNCIRENIDAAPSLMSNVAADPPTPTEHTFPKTSSASVVVAQNSAESLPSQAEEHNVMAETSQQSQDFDEKDIFLECDRNVEKRQEMINRLYNLDPLTMTRPENEQGQQTETVAEKCENNLNKSVVTSGVSTPKKLGSTNDLENTPMLVTEVIEIINDTADNNSRPADEKAVNVATNESTLEPTENLKAGPSNSIQTNEINKINRMPYRAKRKPRYEKGDFTLAELNQSIKAKPISEELRQDNEANLLREQDNNEEKNYFKSNESVKILSPHRQPQKRSLIEKETIDNEDTTILNKITKMENQENQIRGEYQTPQTFINKLCSEDDANNGNQSNTSDFTIDKGSAPTLEDQIKIVRIAKKSNDKNGRIIADEEKKHSQYQKSWKYIKTINALAPKASKRQKFLRRINTLYVKNYECHQNIANNTPVAEPQKNNDDEQHHHHQADNANNNHSDNGAHQRSDDNNATPVSIENDPSNQPSTSSGQHLHVAIINTSDLKDRLAFEHWALIESRIINKLANETESNRDNKFPRFISSQWFQGMKFIECADEFSLQFLKNCIRDLGRLCNNIEVIPMHHVVDRKVVTITLPLPIPREEHLLKLLKRQNYGMASDNWRVLRLENCKVGVRIYLNISLHSMDLINTVGEGKVFCGFERVEVTPVML